MRLCNPPGTITLSLLLALTLLAWTDLAMAQWGREAAKDSREKRHHERERERHRIIVIRKPQWRQPSHPHYRKHTTIIMPRERYVWGTRVIRPHGRPYRGYGYYFDDNDAFKWLAFTAITLKLLDNLNEEQQRLHEAAQVRATTANVGEVIMWEEGNARGSVTTIRRGTSTTGRPCREFQQTVTIGGQAEQAYGTACMNPDGSWEVVP